MKFSIIIPTYNRASVIKKTLQSVLNQSFDDFEVIVVDDGSTDNTKEIVDTINSNKINYYYKENGERGAARNFGVLKAKGKYISFLDSDDLLLPNYFEEASRFIQTNPSVNVFFQLFRIENTEGKIIKQAITVPKNISLELINKGNIFACQGTFILKNILIQHPFVEDRNLAGSEDYELWLRLNSLYEIKINPVVTSILIEHDNRSVVNILPNKLIRRKELMLNYIFENPITNRFYAKHKKRLIINAYAYVSLHLVLAKYKKIGIKYYFKCLYHSPSFIFSKKGLAIVKNIIL